MKLGERFQAENSNLSNADLHCEITRDAEDLWPNSLDDQKRTLRSMNEDDEVVRYMSNLPSYLKRGENAKEKAYSIGVLDWERLEKWQHTHKRTVQRTSRYSTSSTSTFSSHPTDASSSHSSRGRSCSPVNQRTHHPTLQPYPVASPDEIGRQTTRSTGENAFAVEESKSLLNNHLCRARLIHASDQTPKFWPVNNKEESKKRELNAKMFQKIETSASAHVKSGVVRSRLKEMAEVQLQECKYEKTDDQFEKSSADMSCKLAKRPNGVVILLPRNIPISGKFEVSQLPDSTVSLKQKSSARPGQESASGKHLDVQRPKFDSKFSKIKPPISIGAGPIKLSSDAFHPLPAPARASVSPRRSRKAERRTSNVALVKDDGGKTSNKLDTKASEPSSEKVRSSSPFRRFSISVSKIVKTSSSKEPVSSESNSAHTSEKSGLENLESSATSTARCRSSPLRRMLDPLLKPKESNWNNSDDPTKKNSESDRVSRPSKGHPDSSGAQLAKAKLDLTSCRSINVDNSHVEKKSSSSMVQALLRVAFKNGLPLFTFAVDNGGDILAATMKECDSSSLKGNQSWIYTFLTVQEVKKKNGSWINQGGKGKGQGYVPNVVAQMKVSDYHLSNLREFVLFSVESRKQNLHTSEFQPENELAAIVSQIPLKLYPCSVRKGHQGAVSDDMDQEFPPVNMTVILPSGVHSLPSNGGPSSLIQRWRSGGSCDCGGWDLGCQLKVLCGDHHLREKLASETPSATDHFALFPQVDTQENLPEFALVPFKDGIYSIEFNSSLSVLQAFCVCIAVLESRKRIGKWEDQNLSCGKSLGETTTLCSSNGDIPTEYVSNPPLSPIGRV